MTSREDVIALATAAVTAGAFDSYDDCIGGGLKAPEGASDSCLAALAAYRSACWAHHREVYGPALRDYYRREARDE
jgi:hypothetical protein